VVVLTSAVEEAKRLRGQLQHPRRRHDAHFSLAFILTLSMMLRLTFMARNSLVARTSLFGGGVDQRRRGRLTAGQSEAKIRAWALAAPWDVNRVEMPRSWRRNRRACGKMLRPRNVGTAIPIPTWDVTWGKCHNVS